MTRLRFLRLTALLTLVALLAVSCGDSSDDAATTPADDPAETSGQDEPDSTQVDGGEVDGEDGTPPETGDAPSEPGSDLPEVLGPLDPADGEPLVLGFPLDAGGESLDVVESRISAEATMEYVNQHLGGIDGRPLELRFCETQQNAATAAECVNGFVQDGVSGVLVGITAYGEVMATAAGEAGLPYLAFSGSSNAEFLSPTARTMSGEAISVLASPALYMLDRGLDKIAVLVVDVPSATQAIELLAAPAYAGAGIEMQVVLVPPGTADMSANVSTALDADVWLVAGDAAFCTSGLRAVQTLAPETPTFVFGQCIVPENADSLPNGYAGVLTSDGTRLDESDPETALFEAVMATYADEDTSDLAPGFLAGGFTTVLGFARLMEGYTADGSPASVLEHLATATASLPLSGGTVMDCGNPPLAILPSICSLGAWITERTADGSPTDFERLEPATLFA